MSCKPCLDVLAAPKLAIRAAARRFLDLRFFGAEFFNFASGHTVASSVKVNRIVVSMNLKSSNCTDLELR